MNHNVQSKSWITSFSGLRFLIVIFLCCHHFDIFNDLQIPGWQEVMKILTEGYLSVNFFLILSGFVIQFNYYQQFQNKTIGAKGFWINRVAHLWPIYLLALFTALLAYQGSYSIQHFQIPAFWYHVFMLQTLIPDPYFAFQYNGAAWTVSVEFVCYILYPLIAQLKSKYRNMLMVGIWITIVINAVLFGATSPIASWIYYINPVFRLSDFLFGIFLCELYEKRKLSSINKKSATIMEIISIFLLICCVGIAASSNIGWEWRWQLLYMFPCGLLVYSFSFDSGYVSNFIGNRVFRFLGELALPIYLFHQIILAMIKKYCVEYLTSCNSLILAGCIGIALSILISIPIYFCFIKPINKIIRNTYKNSQKRKRC